MSTRTIVPGLVLLVLAVLGSLYVWSPLLVDGRFSPADSNHSGSHSHSHSNLDPVEVRPPYPTLDVSLVREDDERVLYLKTENFTFESNNGDTEPDGTHGHAHLFVDDEPIAMFYADRYVLPDFMEGRYELKVTLNEAGSHAPLSVNGTVVSDTLEFTVERPKTPETRQ